MANTATVRHGAFGKQQYSEQDSRSAPASTQAPAAAVAQEFFPLRHVMDKLFSEHATYYTTDELAIVIYIARRINKTKGFAHPGYKNIAAHCHCSVMTVRRVIARHCDKSPAPLLKRQWTPGYKSQTYTVVRDPEAFAKARDDYRAANPRPKRARKPSAKQQAIAEARRQLEVAAAAAAVQRSEHLRRPAAPLSGAPSRRKPIRSTERGTVRECVCGATVSVDPSGALSDFSTDMPHVCPRQAESGCSGRTTNTSGPVIASADPAGGVSASPDSSL